MKKHTKIYMDFFGYCKDDVIMCEWCNNRIAVDVNHIEPRAMGGSKLKDYIENLVGMCRECHQKFEAKKISKETLRMCHIDRMARRLV